MRHNPYFSGNLFAIKLGKPVILCLGMSHNPYFSGNLFAIVSDIIARLHYPQVTILILVETSLQWKYV